MKRLFIAALAASLAVATGFADSNKSKLVIPVEKTSPVDGRQMFTNYCAPCHGADARGHGPVSSALRTPPADLTVLAKMNRGKYPDAHIISVLKSGTEVRAHGSTQMPVWGPILGSMKPADNQEKDLRISNLSRYLETLQVK